MFSFTFKSKHQTVAGLTVSDEGIAVACLQPQSESPLLQACAFYPTPATQRHHTLAEAIKTHHLTDIPTNLVLLPDDYQILQIDTPEVPKQELAAALQWQIKDMIDFPVEDAVIDHIFLPDHLTSGKKQLLVIVSRKMIIQRHVETLTRLHCRLNVIDIAIQAARNLIYPLLDNTTSVGLLNLWDDLAKISVISNQDVFINRMSSIGLNALRTIDDTPDSQAIIDSLAVELQRTFDYFERHSRQAAISLLYIISNHPPVPHLADLLQQRLGLECIELDIAHVVRFSDNLIDQPIDPRCLMAIGGAMRGLD